MQKARSRCRSYSYAIEKLGVDAAIIFADILLILEPMGGAGLEFLPSDGPVINVPVRTAEDVDRLKSFDPVADLDFVYEAIRLTRRSLKKNLPLIGFAGAPFTLASYLIEGGSSRNFERTKQFMYSEKASWNKLMAYLADYTAKYLNQQVLAGVQALQLFDSWVGCLSPEDYKEYVLPFVRSLTAELPKQIPLIYFWYKYDFLAWFDGRSPTACFRFRLAG